MLYNRTLYCLSAIGHTLQEVGGHQPGSVTHVQFQCQLGRNFPLKILDGEFGAVNVACMPLQIFDHLLEYLTTGSAHHLPDLEPTYAALGLRETCVSLHTYRQHP